jgi:parallel beta-helix repeat protein
MIRRILLLSALVLLFVIGIIPNESNSTTPVALSSSSSSSHLFATAAAVSNNNYALANPKCGAVISKSTRLSGNVGSPSSPCTSNGLIIGAGGIKLDCSGAWIYGSASSASFGIYLNGKTHVTILHCFVSGFGVGIEVHSGGNNLLESNKVLNSVLYGYEVSHASSFNTLTGNQARKSNGDGFRIDSGANHNSLEADSALYSHGQGINLVGSADTNTLSNSGAQYNHLNGFHVDSTSTHNIFQNLDDAKSNNDYGFYDTSVGSGTAGTANTYSGTVCSSNKLGPSHPIGLC